MTRESAEEHGDAEQDFGDDAVARSPFAATLVAAGKDEALTPARRERLLRNISLAVGVPLPLDADLVDPKGPAPDALDTSLAGGMKNAATASASKGLSAKLWGALMLGGVATVGTAAVVGSGWLESSGHRGVEAAAAGPSPQHEPASTVGVGWPPPAEKPELQGSPAAASFGDAVEPVPAGGPGSAAPDSDVVGSLAPGSGAPVAEESGAAKLARAVRPRADSDSLSKELALIDSARAALLGGQPAAALRTLNTYRAQFPKGALRAEATVQRVEALIAVGDRRSALVIGESFLERNPESPYSPRIASLLGVSREPRVDAVRKNK